MGTNIYQISVLSKQQKVPSRRCDVQSMGGGKHKGARALVLCSVYWVDEERDGAKAGVSKSFSGSLNLIAEI